MSDTSTLSELARFIGKSKLASDSAAIQHQAVAGIARSFVPRTSRGGRVADLLGVVMALSARARRTVQPRVDIDLDVFSPHGRRAVRVVFGEAS
jgi:hypothetical protein